MTVAMEIGSRRQESVVVSALPNRTPVSPTNPRVAMPCLLQESAKRKPKSLSIEYFS